jgi:hypothetical protein
MARSKSVSATSRASTSAHVTRNKQAETAGQPPDPKPAAEPVANEKSVVTGSSTAELAISSIRLDGGTQSRAVLSRVTVTEYSEAMTGGATFPPVVVYRDAGGVQWLADGFHRVHAAQKNGQSAIKAEVRDGSQRDAILFSVSANAAHGLRRSAADKKHAVELLLADGKWSKKSDRWIAEAAGVGHPFVAKVRSQLESDSSSAPRVGQDGKTRKLRKRVTSVSGPITIAMAPADEPSALADLESDIERHMRGWMWTPERFTVALETWAQLARDHFGVKAVG